jgi:formylglycine-generating enzyme required for sulfatase activity
VEPVTVPIAPPAVLATPAAVQPNPQAGRTFKDCDLCPEMVVIPAGSFTMGSDEAWDDEKPPHRVNVQAFAISRTEVTQAQWKAVMGSNPSRFSSCGDDCPMESVSWNDLQEFIRRVNRQTGKTYRLPSEAEWEYAARAGSSTRYSFGDSSSQLGDYAWHEANSGGKTQRTGQKRPNSFGLHDMHGNVREWVQDCWEGNYRGAPTDGSAWTRSCAQDRRVVRGGSWNDSHPSIFRSTTRASHLADARNSHVGFRLVRSPN